MSRPKKRVGTIRDQVLHVYVTKSEKGRIYKAAEASNQDASSYCRDRLIVVTDKRLHRARKRGDTVTAE